jgi:hypothetical protein
MQVHLLSVCVERYPHLILLYFPKGEKATGISTNPAGNHGPILPPPLWHVFAQKQWRMAGAEGAI